MWNSRERSSPPHFLYVFCVLLYPSKKKSLSGAPIFINIPTYPLRFHEKRVRNRSKNVKSMIFLREFSTRRETMGKQMSSSHLRERDGAFVIQSRWPPPPPPPVCLSVSKFGVERAINGMKMKWVKALFFCCWLVWKNGAN